MLKRFEYLILSFFLALSSIFAANPFSSLTSTFGEDGLGGTLFTLFGNAYFLIVFYFILLLIGCFKLFQSLLGGLNVSESASKTVSFMISFIGVSGIFFIFKKDDPVEMVRIIGGTFGTFIAMVLFTLFYIIIFKRLYKNENMSTKNKWFYSLSALLVLILVLKGVAGIVETGFTSAISSGLDYIYSIVFSGWFISFILFILGAFMWRRSSDNTKARVKKEISEMRGKNPINRKLTELENAFDSLEKNHNEISKQINSIKSVGDLK
jgi:hypothetical protein